MDEQEWLACTDPTPMLSLLRGKASEQKLRLFATACCRRVWRLLRSEDDRLAVEVAERFADGLVDEEERSAVAYLVGGDKDDGLDAPESPQRLAEVAASWAVQSDEECEDTLDPDTETCAILAARCAAQAARSRDREAAAQCRLLRDIFGNPFRPVALDPALRTPAVLALAQAAYDNRTLPAGTLDADRLAVLADALEEVGCTNADIPGHLRGPGPHVRGCRVVDLLLRQE